MTQFLPPNLISLFFPREPLPYKEPPKKKKCPKKKQYTGISQYLDQFEEPKEEPVVIYETRFERRERKRLEKLARYEAILEERRAQWDPNNNPDATADPYKTLFVARLNYETQESRLKREFEVFGPIKTIRIINDKNTGRSKGYAFIQYEHTRDMHAAYKNMDGKKIDGQRIIVDAERGRVEDDWKPRYLGGGLGGHRRADRNKKTEVYTPRSDDGDRRSHRRSSRDDKKRSRDRDHSRKRDRSRSKHDKKKHRDEEKRHDRKHY